MVKKSSKPPATRKELRKQKRENKKQSHNRQISKDDARSAVAANKLGPLMSVVKKRNADAAVSRKAQKSAPQYSAYAQDPEDQDIERLEKLLGIEKDKAKRSKSANKLNKEYEMFEGIGDDFGEFLIGLDDIINSSKPSSKDAALKPEKGRKRQKVDSDDAVVSRLPSKSTKECITNSNNGSSRGVHGGHILDDDEQEQSDIDDDDNEEDDSDYEENDDYNQGGLVGIGGDDDLESGEESRSSGDDNEGNDDDDNEEEGNDDEEDNDDVEEEEDNDDEEEEENDDDSYSSGTKDDDDNAGESSSSSYVYKPVKGEDIYGRSVPGVGSSEGGSQLAYVPPARRAALAVVNENSSSVIPIRRQVNGLMNRLSDQSKDSIVKSLKQVFDSNSVTVCCTVLRDSIVAACANPSQLMITLIPVYAAVVAGLHFSVGTDVGAYMIESLVTLLLQHMESAKNNTRIRQHDNADVSIDQQNSADLINNKTAGNCILLLVYFYNLRILHHTLIVDLMGLLAHCASSNNCTYSSDDDNTSGNEFLELEFELLECLINHCGSSIRSDDPMSLKLVVSTLTTKLSALFKTVGGSAISADANDRGGGHIGGTSRVKFMFEALTDLKNNKSRRIQSDNADVVKHLRKWLGSMKTVLGCKAGDLCMRVSLKDILDVESRGRWWKTGARWTGSAQPPGKSKSAEEVSSSNNNNSSSSSSSRGMEGSGSVPKDNEIVDIAAAGRSGRIPSAEEVHLMGLAAKLKMNTGARKSIFLVMMSSRDVMDAFERINRIELKGKEDREIARVVTECCGQEDKYNPFYAELALLFCEHNRQFKTTFMFTFWDIFKVLADYPDNVDKKLKIRVANQSRLLATLVAKFHVPLSVIKPIDISSMGAPIISFLTHFFIALFQYEISDSEFQGILDRVATTKDNSLVRDIVTFFLQRHLATLPVVYTQDAAVEKSIMRRRRNTLKTMDDMDVLDYMPGKADKKIEINDD